MLAAAAEGGLRAGQASPRGHACPVGGAAVEAAVAVEVAVAAAAAVAVAAESNEYLYFLLNSLVLVSRYKSSARKRHFQVADLDRDGTRRLTIRVCLRQQHPG